MSDPTWISVLPPVAAIVLAIWSRQVYLSLAGGVWLGWTILNGWNPLVGLAVSIDQTVDVFTDPGETKVLLFTLVIGALIATVEASGGVRGFVRWLETRNWVSSGRGAQLLAWGTGVVIFIESNITVLVAGSVARPLVDRYKVSREKLAYIIDSTSAPICILIPLNAWGAYNLGILEGLGVENALGVFLEAVVLNFYAIAAVLLTLATVLFNIDLGPMKKAEARTRGGEVLWPDATPMMDESIFESEHDPEGPSHPMDMLIPIAVMVLSMPLGLLVTGGGNLVEGDGSTSVLWAVMLGLASAWALLMVRGAATVDQLMKIALKGAGGLIPLALILLLSLALKDVASALGTGPYVAQVTSGLLPPVVFLPLVFLVSAGIAFSTGTSWGTFGIMLPIAVPAAATLGLPLAPFVAASLSGGIFGDHCSPISDTTIISSMAAATDHIDHVRTQLPYALIGGAIATVCFALLGLAI
ncbi:MAG TPA: Na+/H+ antiporter NhaC family protein [Longimicrobiales bacterium]|nr:Na+/H+ antiporter NhaC family protein [Longimicrobiales bacterium]